MTNPKLKIGPLPDKTPVKLNIAVEPDLQGELELYSQIYERAYGEKQSVAALIPSMLQAFLASDPGFKKARKTIATTN